MSDAIITNDAKPVIRLIQAKDNAAVKQLVHDVLIEHGISGEGFAGVGIRKWMICFRRTKVR